jgi:2-succinyl-5-enolpyruvyl-6-hydroxy-3-cyclohexene-1-carboxylate synthase
VQQHVFTIAKVCKEFGVEEAIICPGSRSAPLVYAFTQIAGINCRSVVDERSAGFVALGMAQQSKRPVVLICTSGTALLNFFPAVAEAFYQKVPLLILSADRPPELLNQQDGQMIMQKNVFGKHVNASHELLCFDEGKVDYALTERIVLGALFETIFSAGKGPVHINVPLREPLYPKDIKPNIPRLHQFKDLGNAPIAMPSGKLDELKGAWLKAQRKLVIVGLGPEDKSLGLALNKIVNQSDVVILADIVSNQLESSNIKNFDALVQYADSEILKSLEPDLIISIGGPLVSKSLKNWLKSCKPEWHFRIATETNTINTYQNLTEFIRAVPVEFLNAFIAITRFNKPSSRQYSGLWKIYSEKTQEIQKEYLKNVVWSEPYAIDFLLKSIHGPAQIQLANSGSIRFVSWLANVPADISVFGNRGTSGIEGSVSTAIGAALINPEETVVLICGDLSLLYDRNAFWQNELPLNLKIVLLNNFGGRIFEWIDGPSSQPDYLEFFTTPHNRNIEFLTAEFRIPHYICKSANEMTEKLVSFLSPDTGLAIMELQFEYIENLEAIRLFKSLQIINQ